MYNFNIKYKFMWCFSYKCNGCNKPINSTSFDGDIVEITLIDENNKMVEQMYGKYNSYWCVFKDNEKMESFTWDTDGDDVCNYFMFWEWMYIFHCDKCVKEKNTDYTFTSDSDENQWWGKLLKKSKLDSLKLVPYHKKFK